MRVLGQRCIGLFEVDVIGATQPGRRRAASASGQRGLVFLRFVARHTAVELQQHSVFGERP